MSLIAGTQLGPYEVVDLLGAGAMGEVYRARDTGCGRQVAVKVLPASIGDDPARMRRFEQEARAAGALNHPNIVAIHDIGHQSGGSPYVVSELLEGETLRQRMGGMPLPAAQGDGLRDPDRARAGRGAREGDRPPRPEARQHLPDPGRAA